MENPSAFFTTFGDFFETVIACIELKGEADILTRIFLHTYRAYSTPQQLWKIFHQYYQLQDLKEPIIEKRYVWYCILWTQSNCIFFFFQYFDTFSLWMVYTALCGWFWTKSWTDRRGAELCQIENGRKALEHEKFDKQGGKTQSFGSSEFFINLSVLETDEKKVLVKNAWKFHPLPFLF